jgi:hypothetical protein
MDVDRTNSVIHANRQSIDINLPQPRIWKPEHLADFFGFSVHWVYKQTGHNSPDPPPRCKGFRLLRFDTQSPDFQAWILRQLACYSIEKEG